MALHRHTRATLLIVHEGVADECGFEGRVKLSAGDAVLYPSFHAHRTAFGVEGAKTSMHEWEVEENVLWGAFRGGDADYLHALAKVKPTKAVALVQNELTRRQPETPPNWLCDFRDAIAEAADGDIGALAARSGRSREQVSRAFKEWFGFSPRQWIAERRLRRSIVALRGKQPLSAGAIACGYSDQSHMGRALVKATGFSPARLRRWLSP